MQACVQTASLYKRSRSTTDLATERESQARLHSSGGQHLSSIPPDPEAEKTREMAIKMDKTVIIVCAVVGSLGVLSAILGFSAEGTKLTVSTTVSLSVSLFFQANLFNHRAPGLGRHLVEL